MCTCACVPMCVCVACVHVCVCEQICRGMLSVFLNLFPPMFWDRVSRWTCKLPIWLASPRSFWSLPFQTQDRRYRWHLALYIHAGNPNSGPRAWVACSILNESPPLSYLPIRRMFAFSVVNSAWVLELWICMHQYSIGWFKMNLDEYRKIAYRLNRHECTHTLCTFLVLQNMARETVV